MQHIDPQQRENTNTKGVHFHIFPTFFCLFFTFRMAHLYPVHFLSLCICPLPLQPPSHKINLKRKRKRKRKKREKNLVMEFVVCTVSHTGNPFCPCIITCKCSLQRDLGLVLGPWCLLRYGCWALTVASLR